MIYDGGMCIGGLEAVEYFESLPVPSGKENLRDQALNRIKYECAKGIGKKLKITPPPKPGYHETRVCGHCGYGCYEPQHRFCPMCGTAILKNEHTEKKVKAFEEVHQVSLEEWMSYVAE